MLLPSVKRFLLNQIIQMTQRFLVVTLTRAQCSAVSGLDSIQRKTENTKSKPKQLEEKKRKGKGKEKDADSDSDS